MPVGVRGRILRGGPRRSNMAHSHRDSHRLAVPVIAADHPALRTVDLIILEVGHREAGLACRRKGGQGLGAAPRREVDQWRDRRAVGREGPDEDGPGENEPSRATAHGRARLVLDPERSLGVPRVGSGFSIRTEHPVLHAALARFLFQPCHRNSVVRQASDRDGRRRHETAPDRPDPPGSGESERRHDRPTARRASGRRPSR